MAIEPKQSFDRYLLTPAQSAEALLDVRVCDHDFCGRELRQYHMRVSAALGFGYMLHCDYHGFIRWRDSFPAREKWREEIEPR